MIDPIDNNRLSHHFFTRYIGTPKNQMNFLPQAPTAASRIPTHPAGVWNGFGLLLALLLNLAWATPAGTVIRNQAQAMVEGQTYLSNVVETVVQAVCVPSLSPNGSPTSPALSAMTLPGGFAYFSYLLRNSGNQSFNFSLDWVQDSASWAPSSVRFYHDINSNARLDAGEPEVSSVTLAPSKEIRLILALQTPSSATGSLHISPVATCPDGSRDHDNYSRVSIGSGPALNIAKSVDTPLALEGQEVGFSIRVWNLGNARAEGPIYVSDALDTPELHGLIFVAGSASAAKGRLEFRSDDTWGSQPPQQVRGIRLVLDGLEPGEEALFSFRLRVVAGATPGQRQNTASVASVQAPGDSAQVEFQIAGYRHALGPIGRPQATGSEDQQSAQVLPGQPHCFSHTLLNSGNLADSYNLEAVGLPPGLSLNYVADGGSLSLPIALQPGSQLNFKACLPGLPAGTAPFEFTLQARSVATGAADPTLNQVQVLDIDISRLVLRKSSQAGPGVAPGELVAYTLLIENPLPIALEGLVEDVLDEHLEFISASDGGSYEPASRTVRWRNLSLQPGSRRTLTLQTRVSSRAPAPTSIPNFFSLHFPSLRSELIPNRLLSNTVTLMVQNAVLLLDKQVQPTQVSVGDRLTYTLTLVNAGQVSLKVRLEDTPDAALAYIPGSASLGEPMQQQGRLVWESLTVAPGERIVLRYQMRVLPGAAKQLQNSALALGLDGTDSSSAPLASAIASATVQLQQGVLSPPNSLLGRVFLDTDRDGRYTAGLDVPLPGARILLSNGLQTLTDAEGRYGFGKLSGGVWEVMLEPASAPFKPLPHPEALDDGYRHRVWVTGLTHSDFPLERPRGQATAVRETTLEFGPLRVSKKLLPLPEGLRVVLVLQSTETLHDLTLTDPLPGGGERVFNFAQFHGQQTLTYDLPGGFLTDPQVRWRYP